MFFVKIICLMWFFFTFLLGHTIFVNKKLNKLNFLNSIFTVFEKNKFSLWGGKYLYKNNSCLWSNHNVSWYVSYVDGGSSMMDIVCYENDKNVKTNKLSICKDLYFYRKDLYLSLYDSGRLSDNLVYCNSIWLEREVSEFFSNVFYINSVDTRNLLNEYSFCEKKLDKSSSLQGSFDRKDYKLNAFSYVKSQQIDL